MNLPSELGGGFTMVVVQPSAQPTVRSITAQAIGMTQATNTRLLEADEWGLSLPPEDDDDDPNAPRVFLHPDTAVSLILQSDDGDPSVDLLRLRAAKTRASPRSKRDAAVKQQQAAAAERVEDDDDGNEDGGAPVRLPSRSLGKQSSDVQRISSDDAQEADRWTRVFRIHCTRAAGREERDVRYSRDPATVRSPFDPPTIPTPPHLTHVRHALLQQLKCVQPPRAALPTGIICLLFPAPLAPPLLSAASSGNLGPPSPNPKGAASTNGTGGVKKATKEQRRREEERRKEREKEVTVIDALLTGLALRGIGQYRPRPKKKADEDDDDDRDEDDERQRRKAFAWCGGEVEVPLLFVALQPPVLPSPSRPKQKPGPTENAFVLTSLRAVLLESGAIVTEMRIGPGSGGVIEVPKKQPAGGADGVRMAFTIKALDDKDSNVSDSGDEREDDDVGIDGDDDAKGDAEADANGDDGASDGPHRRKRPRRTTVAFLLPSTPLVSYLQAYVLYMQSSLTLTHALHCLSSSSSSQTTATPYRHALHGWTMLLKSFIGPLVFGPLRVPLYTHQIKQLLARVQQLELKNVQITSLKLLQFHLPRPELTEEGEEGEEDFIPSLSLRSYKGHPDHEYTFDVWWSCPSFLVRVEIQGRKLMTFKLELEMRGVEVSGSVLLRSTPYAPEQLAVSFEALPSLSFGVSSQVVVGSVRLPFQHSIERLITSQIQQVLQHQLAERAVHPRWVSVFFPKAPVSALIDRWNAVAKFPFQFNGKDDDEMMGLALVVTTQAEQVVGDTLREMRRRREEMEGYMTRPLYGEEGGEEWQRAEKARVLEREKEREKEEQSERAAAGGGQKGKTKKPSIGSSGSNSKAVAAVDRDAAEAAPTPSKVKKRAKA